MKIGIVTQPLIDNYGGILQAYALQKALQNEGHQAITLAHNGNNRMTGRVFLSIGKQFIRKYIFRKKITDIAPLWMYKKRNAEINRSIRLFLEKYIQLTPVINNFSFFNASDFDAFIVGSDQVWRPAYNRYNLHDMFLVFVKDSSIRRISYAASFGVSDWEYSDKQTEMAKQELAKFSAVSVREKSAVILCKEHLHTDAQLVVDPTLLLNKEDYLKIIAENETTPSPGKLFCYCFSLSEYKRSIISHIAEDQALIAFDIKNMVPHSPNYQGEIRLSVPQWLRSFSDADFIVTDSFHGTVFSLIFNKPFLVIGHPQRGLARFDSLLSMFALQDRYLSEGEPIRNEKIVSPIDWERVNRLWEQHRREGLNFLRSTLG